jgi:PhnB protein
MGEATNGAPERRHSVVPHLVVKGGAEALTFYIEALGARELRRMPTPDGRLMHGSFEIGDSVVMLCDEFPEHGQGMSSPLTLGGTPMLIHLNVDDVDASFSRAVAAGAKVVMPPADMFWGDRYGQFIDPFGHRWSMSTPSKAGAAPAEVCMEQAAEAQPA